VACHFRLKLFTLDQALVVKTIGHLSSQDIIAIRAVLTRYVDIVDTGSLPNIQPGALYR
jgi:hypothetical protein